MHDRSVLTLALSMLQHFDFPLPSPLKVFEMLVVPEQEYPLVCVAISQGSEPSQVARFETINLNSCSSWFTEMGARKSLAVWRRDFVCRGNPVLTSRCDLLLRSHGSEW